MCPRDVEEVVACQSDPNGRQAFGRHDPVETSLEVGIYPVLVRIGSLFPTVDSRVDLFHRQVCAFYEPHLDLSTAP